ncbi:MAG TPA: extracellular solute-binding protein [Burkholderiales bacterium]|nr:extracellular solute-binding protein [Burkholderiales bacterium]
MKKALAAALLLWSLSAAAVEEIRLWHGMSGAAGAQLDRVVAAFNASQRNYRVASYFQGPFDETLAREIRKRGRSAHAPQIVQAAEAASAEMLQSALARPLWQLMRDTGAVLQVAYLPAVAAAFADEEGRLLALPFNGATPVLYYNRAAFRRARLDPERPPRTWYEMPELLGALVDAGERCALTGATQAWVLENMSARHNQQFATAASSAAGARLAFNGRLTVRWISMLASWHKAGYFTYAGRGEEAQARFAAGECAMLTASSATYAELRQRAGLDFGVAPLPYFDDFDEAPQNTLVGGSALWVMATVTPAQARAAAAFFAFAARAEMQADWHRQTGDVPLTLDGYELARQRGYYLSEPGPEVAVRQLLAPPKEASHGMRLSALRRIRAIIDEELETVWLGSKTPLEALNAAVARGNLLLEATPAAVR